MTPEKEVVVTIYGLIQCAGAGGLLLGAGGLMLLLWEFLHWATGGDRPAGD